VSRSGRSRNARPPAPPRGGLHPRRARPCTPFITSWPSSMIPMMASQVFPRGVSISTYVDECFSALSSGPAAIWFAPEAHHRAVLAVTVARRSTCRRYLTRWSYRRPGFARRIWVPFCGPTAIFCGLPPATSTPANSCGSCSSIRFRLPAAPRPGAHCWSARWFTSRMWVPIRNTRSLVHHLATSAPSLQCRCCARARRSACSL
jgi:hypothetical protein